MILRIQAGHDSDPLRGDFSDRRDGRLHHRKTESWSPRSPIKMPGRGSHKPIKGSGQPLPSWARMLSGVVAEDDRGASRAGPRPAHQEPARSETSGGDAMGRRTCEPLQVRRSLRCLRCPPGRTDGRRNRGASQGGSNAVVRRREGRAGVRPQDDGRVDEGQRRRIRVPGEELWRQERRRHGPLDGLCQFPGPLADLPWGTDRGGGTDDAGRGRVQARGAFGTTRTRPRLPSFLRCPSPPARISSTTTPNGRA